VYTLYREVDDLKSAIKELVASQIKSEERLSRLETAIEKLTEAQTRTEKRLEEFIIVVGGMQKEIRSINQQLGGLAHAVFLTTLEIFSSHH